MFTVIVDAHKFFVKESPIYVSRSWFYYAYYPVAYVKFMKLMITDELTR